MSLYVEGDVPFVSGGNNGGMWGQDGIWAILLLALLGNRGFGFGGCRRLQPREGGKTWLDKHKDQDP